MKVNGITDKKREIIQTLEGLSTRMKRDESCLTVDLCHDANSPNVIYLVGLWLSQEAFEKLMISKYETILNGFESLLNEPIEMRQMMPHRLSDGYELCQFCFIND